MKKIKVGINGFGRIGRVFFRQAFDNIEIVGINDLCSAELSAHLLKYDSAHGVWEKNVKVENNNLVVDGQSIALSQHRNPADIPWKKWGVDIVVECTGIFKTKEDFSKHLLAGAKKVIVSAPAPGVDCTIVYGVNHKDYEKDKHNILSNASCTTNCLAPLVKVLDEAFGIDFGMMTTIHSYTNDQNILDAPHSDFRRARAGALSMIPTSTGAAKAVTKVLPHLKGKIDGLAVRVPTANVSLVDFVMRAKQTMTKDKVLSVVKEAASGSLQSILSYETKQLVSSDFNGSLYSSIVDMDSVMILEDKTLKILSWYDNENGFSARMLDLVNYIGKEYA
ncbi:MAG: type I glyceraldehyde-3-phosphate dehydrogenase [Bdellovibrionaceae bacterium]|nr:type I glyceraldehyde-3-phosphate dehydrogenase [Pseudobdellovibrionaceae bacterium]